MILYPAIDLKDGKAVRLLRGDMGAATVFNDDPAAQAMEFVEAGCDWLHLVDLNGAFAGAPVNAAPVEAILERCRVPAQLGGGIRDMATIEAWLSKGLARVILGTVAVENPALVREAARAFPGQVAVGIDARNGLVATKGWAEETDVDATDLAKSFEDAGVAFVESAVTLYGPGGICDALKERGAEDVAGKTPVELNSADTAIVSRFLSLLLRFQLWFFSDDLWLHRY